MITVKCTWGDGPDIIMDVPHDSGGQRRLVDLTTKQAERLAQDLLRAISIIKDLEAVCGAHDKTPTDSQPTYKCVCCHKNWVDVEAGFDTCPSCLKNV